jgi:crotonobetainyl-CoA:carnitine CoA-transferase CaiB-like acyl-CoA transferase
MLPLQGVRLLAFESWGAGSFGSMLLAQLGAEVISVENPTVGGNTLRHMGPYYLDAARQESEGFLAANQNKRSLTLNLKTPEGQEILHKLVKTADATLDNLRGDVPAKLGITYEALKAANPKIVCAHISGYGRTGPRAGWPGYDFLMQAEAGWMSVTGEPGGIPAKVGVSVVDLMGGVYGALGLLAAVIDARATGVGRDIDTNLLDIALTSLCYQGIWYLNEGVVETCQPRSAHTAETPSQLYPTQDGWLYIACLLPKFWDRLCEILGRRDLLTDPRFATNEARLAHRDELTVILDQEFQQKPTTSWLAELQGQVPCAPVLNIAQALDNPYVRQQGKIVDIAHPERGRVKVLASPFHCPGEEIPLRLAPHLGDATEAILTEMGYKAADIKELREAGVI